eukprot:CAMPEP_0119073698 /NCGR_PEP_ID=MMETSP1178-20130426/67831_1 /TAXON_ID=33656 /ORGANISM="unid sp, Strain CCMP2000" /LENGTH=116 /DNA_ID=CAMNT_0007055801 /DNA_START=290 /DNA_END=640 /DNA_ORIENTATION=-
MPGLLREHDLVELLAQVLTDDEAQVAAVGSRRAVAVTAGSLCKLFSVIANLLLPLLHQRNGLLQWQRALARSEVDVRQASDALVLHLLEVLKRVHHYLPTWHVGGLPSLGAHNHRP